jgi:hypothetical protein
MRLSPQPILATLRSSRSRMTQSSAVRALSSKVPLLLSPAELKELPQVGLLSLRLERALAHGPIGYYHPD